MMNKICYQSRSNYASYGDLQYHSHFMGVLYGSIFRPLFIPFEIYRFYLDSCLSIENLTALDILLYKAFMGQQKIFLI